MRCRSQAFWGEITPLFGDAIESVWIGGGLHVFRIAIVMLEMMMSREVQVVCHCSNVN